MELVVTTKIHFMDGVLIEIIIFSKGEIPEDRKRDLNHLLHHISYADY